MGFDIGFDAVSQHTQACTPDEGCQKGWQRYFLLLRQTVSIMTIHPNSFVGD